MVSLPMGRRQLALLTATTVAAVLVTVSAVQCPGEPKRTIALGVFLPEPYRDKIEPVIHLALDHINRNTCLLNGIDFQLILKDTQCKTSMGMKALFDLMNHSPRPFALFGDMCTNVNEPVAMASKFWHLLHLSYAETHAKFASAESHELYPTFFRIVPGDRNINSARCNLVYHFNWTRVGTVKQSDDPRYALPHETLTTKLEHGYGIKVIYTAGFTVDEFENVAVGLAELKRRDVRVIIGDFDSELAVRVMCEAYEKGMFGSNYVWILPGYHKSAWWTNVEESNCTVEQISEVLEGHFALEFASSRPERDLTLLSKKTVRDVADELFSVCSNHDCNSSVYGPYVYDGIWTLALAVKRSLSVSSDISHDLLLSAINNSSFDGLTGKIRFENNERLGLIDVYQWRNDSYVNIATYDGAADSFTLYSDQLDGWKPPLDSTVVVRERQYVSYIIFIVAALLSMIGVCLALVFLIINIRYRSHRFIKMSSPNMNNLIIVGSIFAYISVILLGLDTRFVNPGNFVKLCYAKTWILCVGFTIAFGSMFAKTWRVHSIFTNIRMNKKAIKDSKLLLIVGSLFAVDTIVLTLWAFFSPFKFTVSSQYTQYAESRLIIPELERCHSQKSIIFQLILFGTKGLLMILGCFLAWETRHVNVPALNDSKYIGMCVYNVVVMCVIGVSLAFILQDRVNEAYALTSFFIIFCTTLTLSLVFVPKVVELLRNPSGCEQRYRKGMMKSVVGRNTTNVNRQLSTRRNGNEKEHLTRLEEENKLCQKYLHEKSSQLWELIQQLTKLAHYIPDALDKEELGLLGNHHGSNCLNSVEKQTLLSATASPSIRTSSLTESPDREAHSTMVRHRNEANWPWLDPRQPTTML